MSRRPSAKAPLRTEQKGVRALTVTEALRLAQDHLGAGEQSQARSTYLGVLKTFPTNVPAMLGLAATARHRRDPNDAELWLTRAVRTDERSFDAWRAMGDFRHAQGDTDHAIAGYRRALSCRMDASLCGDLAALLALSGQMTDAADWYDRAIALQPKEAVFHLGRAAALHRLGRLDEALASYERAVPSGSEPDGMTPAVLGRANVLHALGRLSESERQRFARANEDASVERRKAEDLTAAVDHLEHAIAMDPTRVSAHYNLGRSRRLAGDYRGAIAAFGAAIDLAPDHASARFGLARALMADGDLDAAGVAFREALIRSNEAYAAAVRNYKPSPIPAEDRHPPTFEDAEVTIGGHAFPAIPPVPDSNTHRPFWTVAVPLHNRRDFMLDCLARTLAQWRGHQHMEILALDNASDPPMLDLVDSVGQGIVRYYRSPQNIGPRRNFNLCLAMSRGHWVHVIPDDEFVLPGYYERLETALRACPDTVGAALTGYTNIDPHNRVLYRQRHPGLERGINPQWLERIGTSNPLQPCAVVVRRAAHERLGGYDLNNLYTPDWELYMRIASFYDWWCEPEVTARYRMHGDNITSEVKGAGAQGASYRQAIEIAETYLPADQRPGIIAKARRHQFRYLLQEAEGPMKADNTAAAFRLVQEALRIDGSADAVMILLNKLAREDMAPLREEVARHLAGEPDGRKTEKDSFAYAFPLA